MLIRLTDIRLANEVGLRGTVEKHGTRGGDGVWIEWAAWQDIQAGREPSINPPASLPPPREPPVPMPLHHLLPSLDEQAAWVTHARATCESCSHYTGLVDHPGGRFPTSIGCLQCQACGSHTLRPVLPCPLGKWEWHNGISRAQK
jgi:hypothetical protein